MTELILVAWPDGQITHEESLCKDERPCFRCKKTKPLKEFYLKVDGSVSNSYCKSCLKAYRNQNGYSRNYQARKRAAIKSGVVDYSLVRKRDKMICYLCGKKVRNQDLEYDHVVPLSKGGRHTNKNVRVTHGRCNRVKSDKDLT